MKKLLAALCALPTLTDETQNQDFIAYGDFIPKTVKFRFIAPFGRVNRNNGKWKMYNVKCRYPFGMDLK